MSPNDAALLLDQLRSNMFIKDCAEAPGYRSLWERFPELVTPREAFLDALDRVLRELKRTNEYPVPVDQYTKMILQLSSLWEIDYVGDAAGGSTAEEAMD